MGKRQQKELARLEQALMEAEFEENLSREDWAPTDWGNCDAYNTDPADVDLEEYSDQVYREPEKKRSGIWILLLLLGLLAAGALGFLKYMGVL